MTAMSSSEPVDPAANSRAGRAWFSRFLLGLAVVAVVITMWPLATPLLLGAVGAAVLWAPRQRLCRRFGGRAWLAAAVLVAVVLLVLLVPTIALGAETVSHIETGVQRLLTAIESPKFAAFVADLPNPLRGWAETLLAHTSPPTGMPAQSSLDPAIAPTPPTPPATPGANALPTAAGWLAGFVSWTWSALFLFAITMIALYAMLEGGDRVIAWLERTVPMPKGQLREMLHAFRNTTRAVVLSSVVTSAAQAIAAGVGFAIAGVPSLFFFTAITFLGAFIPAIGAAMFTLPAAGLLWLDGSPGWALFLVVWAFLVVGLTDNLVRPILVGSRLDMPSALVFFSLVGGMVAFGPVGLLLGPLTVSFLLSVLELRGAPPLMNANEGEAAARSTPSTAG
jgi:predicted PurR-regulated permease PerM